MHQEVPSFLRDHALVAPQPALEDFLAETGGLMAVLDAHRRIVWASPGLLGYLGLSDVSPLLGARPGEALGCVHARESPLGCGASQACYLCGTVGAILASKRTGTTVQGQGRITVAGGDGPAVLEFSVTAAPWNLGGRHFTVLTLK